MVLTENKLAALASVHIIEIQKGYTMMIIVALLTMALSAAVFTDNKDQTVIHGLPL